MANLRFEYTVTTNKPAGVDFDLTTGGYAQADVEYIDADDLKNNYSISVDGLDRTVGPNNSFEVYPGSNTHSIRFSFDLEGALGAIIIIVMRMDAESTGTPGSGTGLHIKKRIPVFTA